MIGKCKLCQVVTELKYSHIIPEYFYKPMYDVNHRFMQISTTPDIPTKLNQKGAREYLLCDRHEQQFSKYERYVSQAYYYNEAKNIRQNDKLFTVENVDYSLMKLFQLSILWRASVTSLEIFGDVKLGPHEETIRQMLLAENPGKYYEYGCMQIAIIMDKNKIADGLIMPPAFFKKDGFRLCRFTFGGLIWIYVISNHNEQYPWKEFFLLDSGRLTIHKKMFEDIKFLMDFSFDLKKQGKLGRINQSL